MRTAGYILATLLYFTPSMIGWRKRSNLAIFALNIFLGWTCLGWIAALVWALTLDREESRTPTPEERMKTLREMHHNS